MRVARRQFIKTSAVTASVPLMTTLNIDSSEARIGDAVDLTLGYKPGAIRMNLNENPLGPPEVLKKIAMHCCDASSLNIAGYSAIQAALGDQAQLERSRKLARQVSAFYKQEASKLGLQVAAGSVPLPFILLELGERAKVIQQELEKRNIFVRHVESWGLPQHVRVSCGLEADNQAFFRELKTLL